MYGEAVDWEEDEADVFTLISQLSIVLASSKVTDCLPMFMPALYHKIFVGHSLRTISNRKADCQAWLIAPAKRPKDQSDPMESDHEPQPYMYLYLASGMTLTLASILLFFSYLL